MLSVKHHGSTFNWAYEACPQNECPVQLTFRIVSWGNAVTQTQNVVYRSEGVWGRCKRSYGTYHLYHLYALHCFWTKLLSEEYYLLYGSICSCIDCVRSLLIFLIRMVPDISHYVYFMWKKLRTLQTIIMWLFLNYLLIYTKISTVTVIYSYHSYYKIV